LPGDGRGSRNERRRADRRAGYLGVDPDSSFRAVFDAAVDDADTVEPNGSTPQVRDQAGERRDLAAKGRDLLGDQRDRAGDQRDRDGERRDEAGNLGDKAAERRDAEAEERDEAAQRSELASTPACLGSTFDRSASVRRQAASDRSRAREDRRTGASARSKAGLDRGNALADRAAGEFERSQAELDRTTAHDDRGASAKERKSAALDGLTGVYHRSPGRAELEREIARARRTEQPLALAFVDVDHLKTTNDTRGHAAGDRLLLAVVNAIRSKLRPYDLIIRYGGDEFVCVVSGMSLTDVAARFSLVNADLAEGQKSGSITVGFAELLQDDALGDLIARADDDLYRERGHQRDTAP